MYWASIATVLLLLWMYFCFKHINILLKDTQYKCGNPLSDLQLEKQRENFKYFAKVTKKDDQKWEFDS